MVVGDAIKNGDVLQFNIKVYKVKYEPRREKTGLGVSDLVRHKSACTVSEAG